MLFLKRFFTGVLLILVSNSIHAAKPLPFKIGGFTETVFIVSDIDSYTTFFTKIAGWEVKNKHLDEKALKVFWQLPQTAKLTQRLVGNIGEERGYIRLVQINGVSQQRIRSNTQSWDTGGIFDINMRVTNMAKKFKQLQTLGWSADSDPVQFSFGPFIVKEWIVTGPDGISFALIERIKPTLEGWPNVKEFSRTFNSTQVVRNINTSTNFYREVLGFKPYLEHKGASSSPGKNVLGLPYNLTTDIERSVDILHPDGINEGSIELLQFHGAVGKDVSHLAVPPNLGILTLRLPVDNLSALEKHLSLKGIQIVNTAQIHLPPYGLVDMLAIKSPDGNWLEFYQSLPQ
ncbi:VOC family protein [Thalassotalea sp. M1531]|uniref:VOC family protein n=1 Tax=Thalassotalea algicola TaxID=2716224 RepID=A0A7Y0LBM9_9GAMM|nr:VOC family protein [Thalassotalea algicola]NMP30100.1 VOC family protein [Thalassotalea algicola]